MPDIEKDDDEKTANDEFASGFTDIPTPKKAAGTEGKTEAKSETPTNAEAVTAAAAPETPEYIQITKADWENLKASAAKTEKFEGQFSKVFGTMGELQQIVKALQSATPKGMSIDIPADAFAEMDAEFPELAAQLRKGLEKTLKTVRGTGTASKGDEKPDSEALHKLIEDAAGKLAERREVAMLDEEYPDWRVTVGQFGDKDNPYRKWLAAQGAVYEGRINNAKHAAPIIRSIERFEASKAALTNKPKPQVPKPNPQAQRIRDAVQPKGDGGQPKPANTADDDFRSGFASG